VNQFWRLLRGLDDAPYYSGREVCLRGAVLGVVLGVFALVEGEPAAATFLLGSAIGLLELGRRLLARAERIGLVEQERRDQQAARERIRGWSKPKRLAYLAFVAALIVYLVARVIAAL
jgi:hypothetical protein